MSLEGEKLARLRLGDVVAIHKAAFLMNCIYAPRRCRNSPQQGFRSITQQVRF
jgi:hypothetical protein